MGEGEVVTLPAVTKGAEVRLPNELQSVPVSVRASEGERFEGMAVGEGVMIPPGQRRLFTGFVVTTSRIVGDQAVEATDRFWRSEPG